VDIPTDWCPKYLLSFVLKGPLGSHPHVAFCQLVGESKPFESLDVKFTNLTATSTSGSSDGALSRTKIAKLRKENQKKLADTVTTTGPDGAKAVKSIRNELLKEKLQNDKQVISEIGEIRKIAKRESDADSLKFIVENMSHDDPRLHVFKKRLLQHHIDNLEAN
jgi:hypothetical protein